MSSFKLAFKASQVLRQQSQKHIFSYKTQNNLFNSIKQQKLNFSSTITQTKFNEIYIKNQLKQHERLLLLNKTFKNTQFIYLNHKKYLSISLVNLNKETTTTTPSSSQPPLPEEKQQQQQSQDEQKQQEQQQQKNSNGFSRLFLKENAWKVSVVVMGGFMLASFGWIIVEWGAPQLDEHGILLKDEFSDLPWLLQYPKRAIHVALLNYQMFKDPNSDKLLPDPLQPPYYQPPYTLVIEFNGVLAHPEWHVSTGWRYKKRPGLDFFIEQIKYPAFEVVLFVNEPYMSIAPVIAAMDPNGNFQHKLFRESTKYVRGAHIKDLSCLNRDPKKIILIDWDENAYKLQPRNALHRLKKFKGEDDDTDLVFLASFLKMIETSGVDDVRNVLDYYNSEIDPLEAYKINQVKSHEAELKRQKELEEIKKKQSSNPFSWARKYH